MEGNENVIKLNGGAVPGGNSDLSPDPDGRISVSSSSVPAEAINGGEGQMRGGELAGINGGDERVEVRESAGGGEDGGEGVKGILGNWGIRQGI